MSYLRIQERFAVHCSYTAALVSITGVFYSVINKLSFIMSKSLSLNLSNENKHCFFVVLKTECELKCQFSRITEIFWLHCKPKPCKSIPTAKNLFSLQGTPVLNAGSLFSLQGFPFKRLYFPVRNCSVFKWQSIFDFVKDSNYWLFNYSIQFTWNSTIA